jgi:hypothetical protein
MADMPTCAGILAEAFKIYVYVQCSDPWEADQIGVLESASLDLEAFFCTPLVKPRSPSWHGIFQKIWCAYQPKESMMYSWQFLQNQWPMIKSRYMIQIQSAHELQIIFH